MTNVSVLEGIEGIRNNFTTGEIWFVYINGELAEENFGMNPVADGDNLSFWYTVEEDGEAAIENATYVASITVAREEGIREEEGMETQPELEQNLTELYNDTVNLTQGTFMFMPENSTRTYQVNNLTDLGALNATGLNFTASVMQNMTDAQAGNMTGVQTGDVTQTQAANLTTGTQTANLTQTQTGTIIQTPTETMTEDINVTQELMLQSIEGIRNNNTTGEMWFTYIDGVLANRSLGMNNITNGTNISFWYTTEQNREAEIDNATYVANVTVAVEEGMELGENQTGGNQTGDNQTTNQTVVQVAQNQTNLTTFVNVVQTANMTQTLNTENYTVFAPSNEAFNKLPAAARNELMDNTSLQREVLSYHTVSGKLTSEQLTSMNNVTNIGGNVLQINVVQNNIMIQNVNITQIINADNGVICVIDNVLIPPDSGIGDNQTGDNQTGGIPDVNQNGGNQTGIWHFFSIPFEANNTSVDHLLSGVNYNSLTYYNASSKRFENVSRIEPLKAYWINVPNGTQFNASQQFASVEKKLVTVPPSLRVYPGWNALGSPINVTVPAEVAFITLDSLNDSSNNNSNISSFVKVVGPWVPRNNTTGYYQYVGYNGFNGTITENQLGTDEFEVRPFEGYWVFVDQQDLYA
ncbi:MAG: fasciclin domain-containing protein [Methanosarcina flavescens]|jgi:transforming growth factor-beta-induced protein|nr:fasciclin domain-containing protein [Methanosarcina flavescens]